MPQNKSSVRNKMGGTSRCKGLVRIREHVVFDSFSSVHELDENVKEASSSSFNGHFGRLSDNVWHFCVSRTSSATLEWFPVDAGTESSKEEKDTWCPSSSPGLGGATLVATTNVSSVEAVDGENVKLSEVFGSLPLGSHKRSQLESCSFYVEDKVLRAVLLIETETQTQRDEWVQFLGTLLSKKEDKLKQEVDTQEAGEDVVEDLESLHLPAPSPSISARLMLHQGKSKNLMEEEDPFGLLSLTTSALDSFKTTTTNPAPGMFAMDHFGLTEGIEQEHNIEDANNSDDSVTNTDLDCVADTAMDSSSWLVLRQQQSRERSYSHATYSNSSNMVREPYTGTSRRHSMGFGSSFSSMGECLRCNKRLGRLIHTPKICASCFYRFCRDHCNQQTVLTTPESITLPTQEMIGFQVAARAASASELKHVCMDCFVRQQLLISLQEAGVYYASIVDEAGGLSRLVRWKYFDQGPKLEIETHIRARSLGPLSLLSAMFKYQQQPFMFVVVLAQFVQNVENCLETMDFYWPQFLHWGFVNLSNASPSVRVFYLFFLTATARRSVNLALKATWECIAAHWDAMAGGYYKRGNEIVVMLFFVTNINFGEPQSVLPQLLFPQAPAHQRESFGKLLERLYEYVRRVYAVSQRESPFFEWLLARSKEEVVVSSRNVQKQLRACDGVLDPFPTNYHEEAQLLILERRRSGTQRLVETKQRLWNKPAQHIFSDEVRLVRFLVDLCTYLKENIPEPSQRMKKLPILLQEMLRKKHVRPEAALPLSGAMAPSHRVVNVLTNEECDGESCELDGRANHDSNLDALVGAAVDMTNEMEGVLEPQQQEIINYLDGEFVQTYVTAGLIPISRTAPQASVRSSISEDQGDLGHVLPAGCTPLSETAGDDRFSGDEIDGVTDDEINGNDGTNKSESLSSTSSSAAFKCPLFGERFADTQRRIREGSTFSHYDGWALVPVIAKSFDDMRQEVFVLQGLKLFQLIFHKHNLDLWMRYYSIVCAGKDCGLLEVITDAQSLDGLKKKGTKINDIGTSLPKIFERACGRDPITSEHDPVRLELARANFITSMAAYSLFCYIFLVKDRHNGNIMLSTEGHVVHIDFGFVLGIAPGNTFSLETAPFKLTPEMVEIMGAEGFDRYQQLIAQGLLALHLEASQLLSLVYLSSKDSCFPCFKGQSRARIVQRLSRRLCTGWSEYDVKRTAARIVDKSNGHRGTRQYDWFQKVSNGILP